MLHDCPLRVDHHDRGYTARSHCSPVSIEPFPQGSHSPVMVTVVLPIHHPELPTTVYVPDCVRFILAVFHNNKPVLEVHV